MNIKTISDANERVNYLLKRVIDSLRLQHPPEVESQNDHCDDFFTTLDESIIITPFETKECIRGIAGNKKHKVIHYEISQVVVIPAVMYYKDGSGQPEDSDIVPIVKDCKSPDNAVLEALKLWLSNHANGIFENISESELAEEENKFWDEEQKRKNDEDNA